MATSNSYNYSQDRDTLIRSAFELVGVSVENESLEQDDIDVASRVLNVMLKAWIVHGLQVWKRKKFTISPLVLDKQFYDLGIHETNTASVSGSGTTATATLVYHGYATGESIIVSGATVDTDFNGTFTITVVDEDTFTYTAGGTVTGTESVSVQKKGDYNTPRPERILEANRVLSDGVRVTMTELTRNEYENLSDLTLSGVPIQYHYERRLGAGRFYVWNTANAQSVIDYTIELVTQVQIEDLDSSTDDLDMPQEWIEPVIYGLGYRLSSRYGGMKSSDKDRLKKDADSMLKLAKDYDYEDGSLFMAPELERK